MVVLSSLFVLNQASPPTYVEHRFCWARRHGNTICNETRTIILYIFFAVLSRVKRRFCSEFRAHLLLSVRVWFSRRFLLEVCNDNLLRGSSVFAEQFLLPSRPHDLPRDNVFDGDLDGVRVHDVVHHLGVWVHLQDRGFRGVELLHAPVSVAAEVHLVHGRVRHCCIY